MATRRRGRNRVIVPYESWKPATLSAIQLAGKPVETSWRMSMPKNYRTPLTPEVCRVLLGGEDRKKLRGETYLERLPKEEFGVRLYATTIVRVKPNGKYKLDTGGWKTTMTVRRINEFVPNTVAQVYIRKGELFVGKVSDGRFENVDVPFKDGMVV